MTRTQGRIALVLLALILATLAGPRIIGLAGDVAYRATHLAPAPVPCVADVNASYPGSPRHTVKRPGHLAAVPGSVDLGGGRHKMYCQPDLPEPPWPTEAPYTGPTKVVPMPPKSTPFPLCNLLLPDGQLLSAPNCPSSRPSSPNPEPQP